MRFLLLAICAALSAAGCDGTSSIFQLPTAPAVGLSPQPAPGPPPIAPTIGPYYVAGSGLTILAGQRVVDSVTQRGVSCFEQWDANATCRIYEFVAPQDGVLDVIVSGTTAGHGDVIDLFLVEAGGPWVVAFEGAHRERAAIMVKTSKRYGILVLTYPYALPIDFDVLAEFLVSGLANSTYLSNADPGMENRLQNVSNTGVYSRGLASTSEHGSRCGNCWKIGR